VETKTFSIKKEKLEALRKLSRQTGLSQSLLIRMAIDDLLKDKEKLKGKLFSRKGE
jgi:predicted DNA-binding protein